MKKIFSLVLTLLCGIIIIFMLQPIFQSQHTPQLFENSVATNKNTTKKTVWLNIFIHGSFGSLVGLVSLNNVLKDDVQGTAYRDLNRGMRDDIFFFQGQPILQRGLQRILPTFTLPEGDKPRYAAYPIIKAFDEFLRISIHGDYDQYYYTFGWSGLISQQRRRFEAVRLFNALQEEIVSLRAQNIEPKIRLFAHSHGGNLCLNLGAITPILHTKTFKDGHKYSLDSNTDDSIKKMFSIIKTLPTKETAYTTKNQKRLDYVPTEKNLTIDELIMLGTPIQPETENFLASPIFKTIYNVYSQADTVQKMDWISTKDPSSKQRINAQLILKSSKFAYQNNIPHIVQVKIMYDRQIEKSSHDTRLHVAKTTPQDSISFVDSLLGAQPAHLDPDHKMLWFFNTEKINTESLMYPLPTIVLIPLILALIEKNPAQRDIDINVTTRNQFLELFLTKYQDSTVLDCLSIHKTVLGNIKQQVLPWLPEHNTSQTELSIIYQHLFKPNQPFNKKL